ncbi:MULTISPECIES: MlaD family protein [unclassified Pseudonocardia]|uniref:MlaD family protein n=1 Tax=unclassified Pseudonocardia TaxID=2619320 RepID=UPI0001FFE4B9|nr:MlaD family protein [Pseudonocardia sp. Ae707_Ps1]OLM16733.1 hypothetical protein Ae707Ps1_0991 [Pseudonocardia sp. Ae707_Ps1]
MKSARFRAVAMTLTAVVAVAAVVVVMTRGDGRGHVSGIFADASPLVVGSQVRAAGATVGKVESIELDGDKAVVGMALDQHVLPLREDATMTVRPINLLGEQYVELFQGSPQSAPMPEPAVVPQERVSASVDFQQVIDSLGNPTATSLAALVDTLGQGVKDGGPQLRDAIAALAPTMDQTRQVADLLNEQNGALTGLVEQIQPISDGLAADDGAALDRLVGSTTTTLSTVAADRQALDQTLAELPSTLDAAQRTLAEFGGVARETAPVLRSIRPVTQDLTAITGELRQFADAADPALGSLPPVLERADALLDEAAPVVSGLRAAGPDLRDTAAGLRPLGDTLLDEKLTGVMDFVTLWAMSTNGEDGLSHYFRGAAAVTPATIGDLAEGVVIPDEQRLPEGTPPVPAPEVPGAPPGVQNLLPGGAPGEPAQTPAQPDSATGLDEQQEQSMVGQLLGGQ